MLWEKIREYLPHFALFRADRPSTDEEAEVQDPMKIAISQAIEEMSAELENVKDMVKARVLEVADNTLVHLKNLDAELARFKTRVKEEKIAKIENKDGSSSAGAFSVFILVFMSLLVLKRRYVNN